MSIQMQEPKSPWEIAHMYWVTALPAGGDRSFNACLVSAYSLFGTKLSFSTAYQPQTDGLLERIIQNLEDIIRVLSAYGLDFKDSDGFTHDWCTLIPAVELEYKASIHYSISKTTEMLGKFLNPRLPYDTLKKE
ncbi:hypothetical protein O181_123342 [Austropuccinia psidii MF-1]|uniref:Uncharacterized protein n=1 Tax=Austropuccinia psidii MF-1 TaxID=1389203 RepID=A0A9Q3Q5B6_9BASI|nr:hypothetical protein [Austropuccinia psidii MF-1]